MQPVLTSTGTRPSGIGTRIIIRSLHEREKNESTPAKGRRGTCGSVARETQQAANSAAGESRRCWKRAKRCLEFRTADAISRSRHPFWDSRTFLHKTAELKEGAKSKRLLFSQCWLRRRLDRVLRFSECKRLEARAGHSGQSLFSTPAHARSTKRAHWMIRCDTFIRDLLNLALFEIGSSSRLCSHASKQMRSRSTNWKDCARCAQKDQLP